jgi:hypothetical protein
MPPGRIQRKSCQQQRRQAQRLIGRSRRLHNPRELDGRIARESPEDRPLWAEPFFRRAVGEQLLSFAFIEDTCDAVHMPAGLNIFEDAPAVGGLDFDAFQTGQREEKRVTGFVEQASHELSRGLVPQRQDDRRVVSLRRLPLRLERQPQHGHLAVTPPYLRIKPSGPQLRDRSRRIRL